MVFLSEPNTKDYLESTDVLQTLECGIEEMLKACMAEGARRDPVNFLAEWLMRNNPRQNVDMAKKVAAMREEAARRAAGQQITMTLNTAAGPVQLQPTLDAETPSLQ